MSASQLCAVEDWLCDPSLASVVVATSCTLSEMESAFGVGGVMWLLVAWLGRVRASERPCGSNAQVIFFAYAGTWTDVSRAWYLTFAHIQPLSVAKRPL